MCPPVNNRNLAGNAVRHQERNGRVKKEKTAAEIIHEAVLCAAWSRPAEWKRGTNGIVGPSRYPAGATEYSTVPPCYGAFASTQAVDHPGGIPCPPRGRFFFLDSIASVTFSPDEGRAGD